MSERKSGEGALKAENAGICSLVLKCGKNKSEKEMLAIIFVVGIIVSNRKQEP